MPRSKVERSQAFDSPQLAKVSEVFEGYPELPWMLASASIVQVQKIVARRVTAVLKGIDDLSMPRYEILGFLDRAAGGHLAVRDLKVASFLHPPSLTYILDWLEERELVERSGSRADRRSVVITITDAGRALFKRATQALSEIRFGLDGLDEDSALEVAQVLSMVRAESSDDVEADTD